MHCTAPEASPCLHEFSRSPCLRSRPRAEPPEVEGLVVKKSAHGATETIDRLAKLPKDKGITIGARWSHHEKAGEVGIRARAEEL